MRGVPDLAGPCVPPIGARIVVSRFISVALSFGARRTRHAPGFLMTKKAHIEIGFEAVRVFSWNVDKNEQLQRERGNRSNKSFSTSNSAMKLMFSSTPITNATRARGSQSY